MKLKTKIISIATLGAACASPLAVITSCGCSSNKSSSGLFDVNDADLTYKPTKDQVAKSELTNTTFKKGQEDYKKSFEAGKIDPVQETKWMTSLFGRILHGGAEYISTPAEGKEKLMDLSVTKYGSKMSNFTINDKATNNVSYTFAQELDAKFSGDLVKIINEYTKGNDEGLTGKLDTNLTAKVGYEVKVNKMPLNFFVIEGVNLALNSNADKEIPEWMKELQETSFWWVAPDSMQISSTSKDWSLSLNIKLDIAGTVNNTEIGTNGATSISFDWNPNSELYKIVQSKEKQTAALISKFIGLTAGWMSYYMSGSTKSKILTESYSDNFTGEYTNDDTPLYLHLSDGIYGNIKASLADEYDDEEIEGLIAPVSAFNLPEFDNVTAMVYDRSFDKKTKTYSFNNIDWNGYRTEIGHDEEACSASSRYELFTSGLRTAYINANFEWICLGSQFSPVETNAIKYDETLKYNNDTEFDKDSAMYKKTLKYDAANNKVIYAPIEYKITKYLYDELLEIINAATEPTGADKIVSISSPNADVELDSSFEPNEEDGWLFIKAGQTEPQSKQAKYGWAITHYEDNDEYYIAIQPKFTVDPKLTTPGDEIYSIPFVMNVAYVYELATGGDAVAAFVSEPFYLYSINK